MKNYYSILGIDDNASKEEVKKAYLHLSVKFHPDKNNGNKYLAELFKDINEANCVLSDEFRRADYDYRLKIYLKKKNTAGRKKAFYERSFFKTTSIISLMAAVLFVVFMLIKPVEEEFYFLSASQQLTEPNEIKEEPATPAPDLEALAKESFPVIADTTQLHASTNTNLSDSSGISVQQPKKALPAKQSSYQEIVPTTNALKMLKPAIRIYPANK